MEWLRSKRHLRYGSVDEWMEAEGITTLMHPDDPEKQDRVMTLFAELRNKLWKEHLATLPERERRQFAEGTHPSQSHSSSDQAQPYAQQLKEQLASVPYVAEVALSAYHGDRLVICVHFSEDIPRKQFLKDLPTYFKGFEVIAGFPRKVDRER